MKVPKVAKAPKPYTAADIKLLKQHSKARTPVSKIAKLMKRSEDSLRLQAFSSRRALYTSAFGPGRTSRDFRFSAARGS